MALGAAGVRRVGCGLEVGRSVRTASRSGTYCVATRTACFFYYVQRFYWYILIKSGQAYWHWRAEVKGATSLLVRVRKWMKN